MYPLLLSTATDVVQSITSAIPQSWSSPLLLSNTYKPFSTSTIFTLPFNTYDKLLLILLSTVIHYILFLILPATPFLSSEDRTLSKQERRSRRLASKKKHEKQHIQSHATLQNGTDTHNRDYDDTAESLVDTKSLYKKKLVIRNYLVSTFHSFVSLGGVIYFFIQYGYGGLYSINRTFAGGINGTGDEYQSVLLSWSIGYFLYDLICMRMNPQIATTGSYIHHILMVAAFGSGLLLFHNNMSPFHFYLLFEELSTPFLNAKTLFKHYPKVADICSLLFAFSFFLCRILYGTWVFLCGIPNLTTYLAQCYQHNEKSIAIHVVIQLTLFAATRLLNFYWMALILRKVYTGIYAKQKRKRKQSLAAQMAVDTPELDSLLQKDLQYMESLVYSPSQQTKTLQSRSTHTRQKSRKDSL